MSLSPNTRTRSPAHFQDLTRLVFRGHLRSIGHPQGMMSYLWTNQVFLKNFGDHVEKVTERVKEASLAAAKACRRPVKYLNSSQLNKETFARNILAQDGVRNGLACVLSCIEPCWKFAIHRNRMTEKLELNPSALWLDGRPLKTQSGSQAVVA